MSSSPGRGAARGAGAGAASAPPASGIALSPLLTPVQRAASLSAASRASRAPRFCVVTGGTGFVGQRLVEMLVERGAERVLSYDIVPAPAEAWRHPAIEWVVGDVCDVEHMARAFAGADCVWHNAATVGPFHPRALHLKVNYEGTLRVLEACRRAGVRKIVMSSSPSTRFEWHGDYDGVSEAEMPALPQRAYVQSYAETKAMGEVALRAANGTGGLSTVAVAPHQVYGPRDNLFLPNILEAGGSGRLRIFGAGRNRICFTHVDNYAHGLILAENALTGPRAACAGRFYIVTDGATHPDPRGFLLLWDALDEACVAMGFASIRRRLHLPLWLLVPVAALAELLGWLLGITPKLNRFNVKVLTMNRWFRVDAAERDLGYSPVVRYADGWPETLRWFRDHWLPTYRPPSSPLALLGLAKGTQRKIDIQREGTGAGAVAEAAARPATKVRRASATRV
jgi:nucleoside-diphosphate-sugar epimerase